jgi:hypothetical protein
VRFDSNFEAQAGLITVSSISSSRKGLVARAGFFVEHKSVNVANFLGFEAHAYAKFSAELKAWLFASSQWAHA